jgi:hypothetical protein
MRTLRDVVDQWAIRRDEMKRLKASVDAATICEEFLSDLEEILRASGETRLSLGEAAEMSGYSSDHIGRLVRSGKLRNVGRKGAPRVLLGDLPCRAMSSLAPAQQRAYDPNTDARSLRVRR